MGLECRTEVGVSGGITNTKDILKQHMETYCLWNFKIFRVPYIFKDIWQYDIRQNLSRDFNFILMR